MTKPFLIVFALLFTSCLSSKYLLGGKDFEGVVMACKADSTTIIKDTVICLKKTIKPANAPCINCKYTNCDTKPDYYDFVLDWPGIFTFHFKEGGYYFLNNSRPFHREIKQGEKGFEVQYDLDFGSVKLNKRRKTLTLVSNKYKETRIYNYRYSKQDSVLTLSIKKDY